MICSYLTSHDEWIKITIDYQRNAEKPAAKMRCSVKERRLIVIRIVLTVLTVAMIGFIFSNSMADADDSSEQSGALLRWINGVLRSVGLGELSEHFIRKTAHFTEYFVLGALLSATAFAYLRRRGRMLCAALPAGLAVAVIDELIQLSSAGRSCEIGDMALDFCAVLAASLLVMLIPYRHDRKKKQPDAKEGNRNE